MILEQSGAASEHSCCYPSAYPYLFHDLYRLHIDQCKFLVQGWQFPRPARFRFVCLRCWADTCRSLGVPGQRLFGSGSWEQDLETFGCKHGLVAALVFQSEHVALDFRRPSTEVEVLSPPAVVSFELSVKEENRLKSAGVPLALVNYSHLQIRDSHGFPVTLQTDDSGAQTLESPNPSIADGGFPLQVSHSPFMAKPQLSQGIAKRIKAICYENHVSTLFMGIPVMSLAPFPLHTAKLRALRQINQEEYDSFVSDISSRFSSAGIAHVVVDNDYTLRFWEPCHQRRAAYNFDIR
eukprot:s1568_g15.t1